MARIYLDPSALFIRWGGGQPQVLAPDIVPALRDLTETGNEAVLIAEHGLPLPEQLRDLPRVSAPEPGPAAWMITGDRRRCGLRRPGLRTVLVGGGRDLGNGRGRCDAEAADLHGAVIHIVSREAMPA
ncbi:MAG TPA: hypothetical protein VEO91_03165 [Candidatus Limnocylindria bacterium]|jgi:hypothetical protein|nr:hypothetical protein [Candidatus Limnocylindria bacterium]